jgi:phage tail-like protein
VTFQSYLEKSLYPSDMNVNVGTVKTPPGLPPSVTMGSVSSPSADLGKNGQPDQTPEVAGMIFDVAIDGHELGFWSKADGLSVKFELAEYRAGDGNNHRWIDAAFTTYSNVKLGRPTTLKYTKQIMDWLRITQFKSKKVTASIKGYPFWHNKRDNSLAVEWRLQGVLPVAWSGPVFDRQGGAVAMETLELAHEGFLPPEG